MTLGGKRARHQRLSIPSKAAARYSVSLSRSRSLSLSLSLSLSVLAFSLSFYLHKYNSHIIWELKYSILREIGRNTADEFARVKANFLRRCQKCVAAEGHHFQHHL